MNICTLLRSAALRRISYQSPRGAPSRRYSIFQDFSNKLKGEIESNPELKKSLKEFQDLKNRTKESAEHLYKHVDAARGEAQAKAKEVSSVIREKITVASEQVKESLKREPPVPKEGVHPAAAAAAAEKEKVQTAEGSQNAQSFEGSSGQTSKPEAAGSHEHTPKQEQQPSAFVSGILGSKIVSVAKEGFNLIADELSSTKKVRVRPSIPRSKATALVPAVDNKPGWRKRLDDVTEKVTEHPIFQRFKTVKEHPVVTKSHEIAEEIRDRWETSDSPIVHKIQDLNESLFGETASAAAMKEIRSRDPMFSFSDFVLEVQEDVRPLLTAYLKGDFATLDKKCYKGVVDRCRAEQRGLKTLKLSVDNKILYVSDVEVKETKMVGTDPTIIVSFRTQQSYCVLDDKGKIQEGSKNDIRTVYYLWAMQQASLDEMEPEDSTPRWKLREMQQLGVQAII